MTSQMIRRFSLAGEFTETRMMQTQNTVRSLVMNTMKDEGYVPLLDVSPTFETLYRGEERYEFIFTIQGVYIGKEKAWETEGVMDGKLIPCTPKSK